MATRKFQIYRGDHKNGELVNFEIEVMEGMVVLDVILKIQTEHANDLALQLLTHRYPCFPAICGNLQILSALVFAGL